MTRGLRPLIAALMLAGVMPAGISAQGFDMGSGSRTIGVLDQDQMYTMSLFGQRVRAEVQAAFQALERENQILLAELSAREQELTRLRTTLSPEDFRALADEFDTDVEAIRSSQDQKSREISSYQDREEQRFFAAASPLISAMSREAGLQVLLDKRSVILSDPAVDLTDRIVMGLNDLLGTGAGNAEPPATIPQAEPSQTEPSQTEPEPSPEVPPVPAD